MNPLQMAQQIKHKLQQVAWLTGSQEVVFGTQQAQVVIFSGRPTLQQIPPAFPWCLVGIDSGEADEDHPGFIRQNFTLMTAAEVAGDPLGEFAMIGGSTPDIGKSANRGVGELAARVRAAVEDLTGADGARLQLSTVSTGTPRDLGEGKHIVLDEHTVTGLCTSQLHYDAPQELAHDGTDWTWEGTHCSNRFDFYIFYFLEKAGTSPSTSVSDGTLLQANSATSYTGAATSGNTYTVFATYHGRDTVSVEDNSDGDTVGCYKVVY
jgi:hypothetical protein